MATLSNLQVSDTGGLTLAKLKTSERPNQTVTSFTSVGTSSWTCPAGVTSIEVLVVAGGGGGGFQVGGGGGAGGVIYNNDFTVTPGTPYTVVVGGGGAGGTAASAGGSNGSNSQFGSLIAIGG